MPLRLSPPSFILSANLLNLPPSLRTCAFSTLTNFRVDNHYETLGLTPSASAAEIKKQFYHLSLRHHPDKNPSDPAASERFSAISNAYTIIGNPDKRSRYDKEHIHPRVHAQSPSGTPQNGHRGSYAGSRPASGLSKRRGAFREPPPSYYAHGGATRPRPSQASTPAGSAGDTSSSTGAEHAQFDNDVPHFNPHPTYRTQTQEDIRRKVRRSRDASRSDEDIGGSYLERFLAVGIVVIAAGLGTSLLGAFASRSGSTNSTNGKKSGNGRATV